MMKMNHFICPTCFDRGRRRERCDEPSERAEELAMGRETDHARSREGHRRYEQHIQSYRAREADGRRDAGNTIVLMWLLRVSP
jgi:hypothetical protein